MVSVLSNSLWLPRYLKNVQNETVKRFLLATRKLTFLTNHGLLCIRNFTKLYEVRRILLLETAVKATILTLFCYLKKR